MVDKCKPAGPEAFSAVERDVMDKRNSAGPEALTPADTRIYVGPEPFDMAREYAWLAESDDDGAVVTFTGKVRNRNQGDNVSALTLEHYPGMTEKALEEITQEARARFSTKRITVIHRVGRLDIGEQIVLVGVSGAHRGAAFQAAEFIMDYLKTRAPFWKREATPQGDRWVDARAADRQAAKRWSRCQEA